MMSAVELLAGDETQTGLGEALDGVGDHVGLAGAHRLEQIAVGHETEALIPRVVGRREMRIHGDAGRQSLRHLSAEKLARLLREATAKLVERQAHHHVLRPHRAMRRLCRQHLAQLVGDRILGRERRDVARRALEHGDMLRLLGQRRHQRDRGGAAADDDHLLAAVVEILRPPLRVDDASAKASVPAKVGVCAAS